MADIINIGTTQEAMCQGLREVVEKVEDGEYQAVLLIILTREGKALKMRGGMWRERYFTVMGAFESMKLWLWRTVEINESEEEN